MKEIPVADVRSFAFMGHTGSGKTSLVEALLFKLGVNDRLGSVSAGSSMADYTDEEKDRKITIMAKPFSGIYKSRAGRKYSMMFVDTPGYLDFYGQVLCGARAVETGVIVIDASAGIQVGTHKVWKCSEKQKLARAIVVTGLDKENTDFSGTVARIQEVFGSECVPVTVPKPDKSGVVDVFGKDIPADMADSVAEIKNALMERAAETDDALIEKFLGGEELSQAEVAVGLQKAVKNGLVVPIFACMALKDTGVSEFLDGVSRMFPSPADIEPLDKDGNPVKTGASDPFVGFVWRAVNDPFVGQLVFVRVIGGTLRSDGEIFNASKDQKEKVGSLLAVNGKKQSAVSEASAGEVVAIPKLKYTAFGDTLCEAGAKTVCAPVVFPTPVVMMAVTGKSQADEDKIGPALAKVAEDDPTLRVERNIETKEILICGLGDVHIDVAVAKMKSRSNVEVVLNTPKVPYRETVTGKGEGHYKHKKQSGGRGQYAEVYLRLEPRRAGDEEWFADAIVGGVIPGNFIPAVQKGVADGMTAGALAGFPVTDFKATVFDGSFHEVDSSEIAFKIAASRAFKDAMNKARPVLLEPIMKIRVYIDDQHMGDINGDLNHRRGRILGMEPEEGMQVITADVPQAELFRYAAELRSMTGGQGTFEMEFVRYDTVPSAIAQKIIAASGKNKQEEED